MRRLQRSALSEREQKWLDEKTAEIRKTPKAKRKTKATERWKTDQGNQASNPLGDIQKKLQAMCSGLNRCMYCEDSQGHAIDHFRPKSTHPERTFVWANLLYACSHCNSNQKRTQFPLDANGQPLLIDPTAEDPMAHLVFVPDTGDWVARTDPATVLPSPKGTSSCTTFGLNRDVLKRGRRNTWVALQVLIQAYDQAQSANDLEAARQQRLVISDHPFSSVLVYMLQIAALPPSQIPAGALSPGVVTALRNRPEIETWVTV